METKVCSKCKKKKPLSEFLFQNDKGRYHSQCKECESRCRREYRKKNSEKIRKYQKEYRQRPEVKKHKNEYARKYEKNRRASDPEYVEKTREYRREYKKTEKSKKGEKKYREENREKINEYFREYQKNRRANDPGYVEKFREYTREYEKNRRANEPGYREKSNEYSREYQKNKRANNLRYGEKLRERVREYKKNRTANDPGYKLNNSISKNIGKALKKNKVGRHWETLVGYSLQNLMDRLSINFQEGMSFENYGKWHLDHKKPQSLFHYTISEEQAFKDCWSLANLQPLWAVDNLSKNNKWEIRK